MCRTAYQHPSVLRNQLLRRIAIILLLALSTDTSSAAAAELAEEFRAAANAQGKVALGQFSAFKNTYLADVTVQTPTIGDDGSLSGTATFAGQDAPVLLQYVGSESVGIGQWLLAWRLPTRNLGELIPAMAAVAEQGLQLATPVMIFSTQPVEIASSSMAAPVRDFYRDVYGGGAFTLHVEDGVNLVAAIELRDELLAGMQILGASPQGLVLEGVVLKNFDAATLRQARDQGRLTSAVSKDAELRARLTQGAIINLPDTFQVNDFALLVTGKPSIGVAFNMLVGAGSDRRKFICEGSFLGGQPQGGGKSGFSITARSDDASLWRNALGIQGLELLSAQLAIKNELTSGGPPRLQVGVQGDLKVAEKMIGLAGGMAARKGPPSVFLKGSIDSLTRDDLVAMANDLAGAAHGGVESPVAAVLLPEFDLRQVTVNFAPAGGSEELGVESGVGLRGQLYLFDRRAAEVDGLVDVSSRTPRATVKSTIAEFQLGPLTLHDTELDVLMAASADSHFLARGGCDLLGNRVAALANLSAERSEVTMSGRIVNAFDADVSVTSDARNAEWMFSARFKNDFHRTFQSRVSDDILAWARQVERDFAQANADLEQAQRDVQRIDADIAKARKQVERDREINESALRRAQTDLNQITRNIDAMRMVVKQERAQHLAGINKAQQDVSRISAQIGARRKAVAAQREKDLASVKGARDRAKSDLGKAEATFQKAVAAWKKAKGLDKIAKGVDKDAKGIDRDVKKGVYQAAAGAYDAARANLNKVPIDLDPQIVALAAQQQVAQAALGAAEDALKAIHGTAPIDADPRVATLFAARDTAKGAVSAAQSAFDAVHSVSVDADPRVAALFAARDTALTALDVAKAAVGATRDAVQWATKATAAAASGQLLTVESARLKCGLSAFEQGGQMELVVVGRIMQEPLNLLLSVNTADLTNGNLFQLASQRLIPSQQSTTTATRSTGSTQRAHTAGQPTSRPGRAAPTDQAARSRAPSSRTTDRSAVVPSTSPLNVVGPTPRPERTLAAAVSELHAELKDSPQGAGWIKFLKLARLEQLANGDFVDVDDISSEPYSQILKQFDSTAANPEFKAISDKDAFIEVREMLRERAGER